MTRQLPDDTVGLECASVRLDAKNSEIRLSDDLPRSRVQSRAPQASCLLKRRRPVHDSTHGDVALRFRRFRTNLTFPPGLVEGTLVDRHTKQSHPFIDPAVLAKLAGLRLNARQPMLGNVAGMHRSPVRGSSLEFSEYRDYVPGDDTRRMDWRAWGRSDRFYIKEYEADTNLRLCVIVDTSGSLNFKVNDRSKLQYARSLVGTLAYLTSRQGDAVGLYCAGDSFRTEIPPKRNAKHLRLLLDELDTLQASGETGLVTLLHEAAEKISQRALVVVVSDLFLPPPLLRDCFQHLKFRKHDVAVFHLLDRSEIAFDFERPTRFVDMEGGVPVLADPGLIAKHYRQAMAEYLNELQTIVRDTAIDYHRVSLEEPVDSVLARFLVRRLPK